MRIIDISRGLTPDVAVWPGDQPFEQAWTERIAEGSSVNLSSIHLSVHTGSHADAPLHVEEDGVPIDEIPLLQFIGPTLILNATTTHSLTPEDVAPNDAPQLPRVLFKTRHSNVSSTTWDPALVPILPETVERLARQGVVLVGTDAPSVDPVDSKTLDAHKALARHGIVNLENLDLRNVEPGVYWLIALPLKLPGLDAAPVRAVLVDITLPV